MSVKMMHLVFERFPYSGNDMVLALALADHAHDDGTNIYPGNERLATKTRMSERTVIRTLQKFVRIGWLIKVKSSNQGRGLANVFSINPDWIKGDNLSPFIEHEKTKKGDRLSPLSCDGKGDKNEERVTNDAKKGDIAVSPQPSITINITKTTPRASNSENSEAIITHEGSLACRLVKLKVSVTPFNPILCKWVQDKIPIELIESCVQLARHHKPLPEIIPARYLDSIIRSELKPKQDNSWLASDEATIAKGRAVGFPAKTGETMRDYRERLKLHIANNRPSV